MSNIDERMRALRQRYAVRAAADLQALVAALEADDWNEISRIAHGLAGTGAVFGFPELSERGRELDDAIEAKLPSAECRRLADALARSLEDAVQER